MNRPWMPHAVTAVWCGFALSACLVEPTEPDCSGATSCSECTGRSGCGWCVSDEGKGNCLPGTSLGPDEAVCSAYDWRFDGCEEPSGGGAGADCDKNESCASCADDDAGCRWCVESGHCVPESNLCDPGVQQRLGCPCDGYEDCESCHEGNCVWCASESAKCIDATEECASDVDRYHSNESCPQSGCNGDSCVECTSASGCVWCVAGDRGCRPVDRTTGCDNSYADPVVCP